MAITCVVADNLHTHSIIFIHFFETCVQFYTNIQVKIAYAVYLIIVGVLLLNLIIAIMTNAAANILKNPWKSALRTIEWLDESTSTEFTLSVLMYPLRKYKWKTYCALGNIHGNIHVVKGEKVFVEVRHCPALFTDKQQDSLH